MPAHSIVGMAVPKTWLFVVSVNVIVPFGESRVAGVLAEIRPLRIINSPLEIEATLDETEIEVGIPATAGLIMPSEEGIV